MFFGGEMEFEKAVGTVGGGQRQAAVARTLGVGAQLLRRRESHPDAVG